MTLIPHMEPTYGQSEIDAVNAYMNSGGWLTEFSKTREFERMIKEYTGSAHCSVMSNGSVTLVGALMACGVAAGDEVMVPDFTMSATPHAVSLIGAVPVFADIEPDTLCMDFESMERAVTDKTRAVMFVNINGRSAKRFDDIVAFCRERGLWLIEDAAQALGSIHDGKMMGTRADIGSFSFSMPKIITTGQGGAVVTDNDELFEKMTRIRDFGREKTGSDHYVSLGLNFKFSDVLAVIGMAQMDSMPWRVERKKEIGRLYRELLKDVPGITYIDNPEGTAPCFYEILCDRRGELKAYLAEKGIATREFYPPLHSEPAYGVRADCPVSEKISPRGLWLPSAVKLTDEQVEQVCEAVRSFASSGV